MVFGRQKVGQCQEGTYFAGGKGEGKEGTGKKSSFLHLSPFLPLHVMSAGRQMGVLGGS